MLVAHGCLGKRVRDAIARCTKSRSTEVTSYFGDNSGVYSTTTPRTVGAHCAALHQLGLAHPLNCTAGVYGSFLVSVNPIAKLRCTAIINAFDSDQEGISCDPSSMVVGFTSSTPNPAHAQPSLGSEESQPDQNL